MKGNKAMTMPIETKLAFGEFITAWRKEHGLTQVAAARILRQKYYTLRDWEQGKANPHAETETDVRIMIDEYSNGEGHNLDVESIDELRDTFITIGCYRETDRLDRMLRVFHKALTLARTEQRDGDLMASLKLLHDHKGALTVKWSSPDQGLALHSYVDKAWEDECECNALHMADCEQVVYPK